MVVCRDCIEEFMDEDLELMYNMFTAYGGYYGMLSASKKESYGALKDLEWSYKEKWNSASDLALDVRTMHQAFLHGISVGQLVRGLEILLEKTREVSSIGNFRVFSQ